MAHYSPHQFGKPYSDRTSFYFRMTVVGHDGSDWYAGVLPIEEAPSSRKTEHAFFDYMEKNWARVYQTARALHGREDLKEGTAVRVVGRMWVDWKDDKIASHACEQLYMWPVLDQETLDHYANTLWRDRESCFETANLS